MHLWRYNPVTGFWVHERAVTADTAQAWLKVFQDDAPDVKFKVAKNKPR